MNDREMLELAAKAAGYDEAKFQDISGWGEVRYGLSFGMFGGDLDEYWNPLQSDSDAFRLAVDLGILAGPELWHHIGVEQLVGKDSDCIYAATRRAIVRAAAAIGEKT